MVHGRAQHYAWGDESAIPEMVGESPDGQPWAEWWIGTHPLAPSSIDGGASLQSVSGDLPYLLKFMAAARPLSLQTHPDRHQAAAGFEREEQLGIPRDSPGHPHPPGHCCPGAGRADGFGDGLHPGRRLQPAALRHDHRSCCLKQCQLHLDLD